MNHFVTAFCMLQFFNVHFNAWTLELCAFPVWISHTLSGMNYTPVPPLLLSAESCISISSIPFKTDVRLAGMEETKSFACLFGILAQK